jgi:sulfopyruvate decarboxylase subunit beta
VDTGKVLQAAIDSGKMTVIVVKCDSGNIKLPVITMDPVVIRDRFMKAVRA